MKTFKKIIVSAGMALSLMMNNALFGQQWNGNNNTTDPINRSGNVGIGTTSPMNALDIYGDGKRLLIRSQTANSSARPGIIFGSNVHPFFAGDGVGTNIDQVFNFYSVWAGSRTYNAEIRIHGNSATANWDKYLALKHDGTDGKISTDVGSLILTPSSGNVGIGTSSPAGKLDVGGYFYTSPGNSIVLRAQASPDEGGQLRFEGAGTNRDFFLDNYQGKLRFISQDASGESSKLVILNDGTVGIGITNPSATYKLSVNGKVKAAEVVVESTWPDFVFADDYSLRPLDEVEQYLKANKHLPEIPSAKEVSENGIVVGEMQSKLLQKIEELTLYVIELKKENERLHQRTSNLEKQR